MSILYNDSVTSVFYTKRDSYLIDESTNIRHNALLDNTKNIIFPCEVDTEFNPNNPLNFLDDCSVKVSELAREQPTTVLTVQCRAINIETGLILAHPDIQDIARHPVFKNGLAPIDYLQEIGYKANIKRATGEEAKYLHRTKNKKGKKVECRPILELTFYSFFAVAELAKIATGQFRKDLINLVLKGGFEQKRRLRTTTANKSGRSLSDNVALPWIVTLEGVEYRVKLCWIDNSAMHGISSYAGCCEATGVKLLYKEEFKDHEKAAMKRMYIERPDDFDNYALGDLYNYKVLKNNIELFKKIYEDLGLSEYFQIPKLTIGATVRDIFQARIAKEFGVPNNKKAIKALIEKVCKPGNANHLKEQVGTTKALNAKVRGGRCRNNKPTITRVLGVIVDNDISGCYGEGQRNQEMLFGNPYVIDYPHNTASNKYITLGEFLKINGHELVYGCWQAVVTTKELLKHPQDFVNSWIEPKAFKEIANLPTDTDLQGLENVLDWLDKDMGATKIFNNEIINGLINHDFLDWLDNICSKQQRKELLDKLIVRTAMIYPASKKVNSPQELLEKIDNWEGGNTFEGSISEGKKVSVEQECYTWYSVNMGNFLITQLLLERKKHTKKTPLNTLYKLIINTLYGDMVSPFFEISNVVVANNITARARALAYYMEKGLNLWQSITDGGVLDLNTVVFPREGRRLTAENLVNLYRLNSRDMSRKNNLKLQPLTNNGKIEIVDWQEVVIDKKKEIIDGIEVIKDIKKLYPVLKVGEEIISADKCQSWAADKTWEHLQNIFPVVSLLHGETTDVKGNPRKGMFCFEIKDFFTEGAFHGSANYRLKKPDNIIKIKDDGSTDDDITKMRSYDSDKDQPRFKYEKNHFVRLPEQETLTPAEFLMNQLLKNPEKMTRGFVFVKPTILKCGDYRQRFDSTFINTRQTPGDTLFKVGLVKEFSISQFTYQTHAQWEAFEKEKLSLTNAYGQSYEMFYTDRDGKLSYQEMIEDFDQAIESGATTFKPRERGKKSLAHPELACNEALKAVLEDAYKVSENLTDTSWEDLEIDGYSDEDSAVDYLTTADTITEFEGELDLDLLDI